MSQFWWLWGCGCSLQRVMLAWARSWVYPWDRSWRFVALVGVSFWLSFGIIACTPSSNTIVVASKNFTEQLLLGELLAQQIEAQTRLKVDRKFNLGGTLVIQQGLLSGDLDLYVEYTGTAYNSVLKQSGSNDPQQVYQVVQRLYREKFNLEWTEPLGFDNTFAMVVRTEDAQKLNLRRLSQLSPYAPQWKMGMGYEFLDRPDGFRGLTQAYNLRFAQAIPMDLSLIYRALVDRQVDLVAGAATDAQIEQLGLATLADDRQFFPPYEAAPVIRQATLVRHPELRPILSQLAGQITATEMRRLNHQVDTEQMEVKRAIAQFRATKFKPAP